MLHSQSVQTETPIPLLISISEASIRIGVAEQTARDWLWKKRFPVPTVKINGKRLVPLQLLDEYVNSLINDATHQA